MPPARRPFALVVLVLVALIAACSSGSSARTRRAPLSTTTATPSSKPTSTTTIVAAKESHDIYSADRPNQLSPTVKNFPSLVYVPNSLSDTVDVIDPATFTVVEHFATGGLPQHVVPSWDLKTLYVTNDHGNSLTPIDPATGKPGDRFFVEDPYNMYFTPDGQYAIVVAERLARLDFRDAHTFKLVHSLQVPCVGVDHMDFSGDGKYLIASCEFSGQMIKVDVASQSVVGTIALHGGNAKPQDVKVDPTGQTFYVADMIRGGLYVVDGASFEATDFIPTGAGAHGLYVSRDSKSMYVTNRDGGSVSVFDFATKRVAQTWPIAGGSPDMGGVSADGRYLWVSGRYDAEVYVIDTTSGAVVHRISVGSGPHGLCLYPQPGRYSLGHTGVFR